MNKHTRLYLILLLALFSVLAFGFANADDASISGAVFTDNNADGYYSKSEKAPDGTELRLFLIDGHDSRQIAQTTIGNDGNFSFINLAAGTYFFEIDFPAKTLPSLYKADGNIALPSNSNQTKSSLIRLENGERFDKAYIANTKKSSFVRLIAFGDENANGGRFSSEPLLRDVEVSLIADLGDESFVLANTATDKDGVAEFRNLGPGLYKVYVSLPEPYIVGPLGSKLTLFFNAIIPNDDSKGYSSTFELKAGTSVGLGAGAVLTGQASGAVWFDEDYDGKKNSESSVDGIELVLSSQDEQVNRTISTDSTGSFYFDKLPAGKYNLTVKIPNEYSFTKQGDSMLNNEFLAEDKLSFDVSLGSETKVGDIGITKASALRLVVFHDANANGLMDDSEPPYPGAKIEILDESKAILVSTSTEDGTALFPHVKPSNLGVKVTLGDGQIFSVYNAQGNVFYSEIASSSILINSDVERNETKVLMAGVTLPANIEGSVFDDENLSGVLDQNEAYLQGIKIAAINSSGSEIQSTTTDEQGKYQITNIVPGSYKIRIFLQSPYVFSSYSNTGASIENKISSQNQEYGETEYFDVLPAETKESINAAAFASAIINGSVLNGYEQVGFDENAQGLKNIRVELVDENSQIISEHTFDTTASDGSFSIKGALPGSYRLKYVLPDNISFTKPYSDDREYISDVFTVKSKDVLQMEAIYAVKTSTISGHFFEDIDSDGLFANEDTLVSMVNISLTSNRNENYYATTNENGHFAIANIRPGDYEIKAELPNNLVFNKSQSDILDPLVESTQSKALFIAPDTVMDSTNIALSKRAELKLKVFYDHNMNKSFDDGEASWQNENIEITHIASGYTSTATSDANGDIALSNLLYGEYLLKLSFVSSDIELSYPNPSSSDGNTYTANIKITNETQNEGFALIQYGSIEGQVWNLDMSNSDISDLSIKLLNENQEEISSTLSSSNGKYSFNRLLPGTYYLSTGLQGNFKFARILDTQVRTSIIVADNNNDSRKGVSSAIQLSMGENLVEKDIGIGAMGKLGDFAWLDIDGDGMQDGDEKGIPRLTIKLYQYGQMVNETTTDEYGRYSFDSVYPGSYTVEVTMYDELLPTKQQNEFPLVASVLSDYTDNIAKAYDVIVPSNGRNLNSDFGFVLKNKNKLPSVMLSTPKKDWTPLVPYKPQR